MKKRADGRYCKQVLVGYHSDGRRKMKTIYGKTIKEVEKKERELRENVQIGINVLQENITVEEWGKQWLIVYKAKVSKGTYEMYEKMLKNHIIPSIGNIPLTKLKPINIQGAINNILSAGNNRTAEIYKLTIKQIIKQAVEEGLMVKNICSGLDKIKSTTEEKRPLTDFELKCIAKTQYTNREKLFLDVLYYTGMRRGEALALTIWDIDKKAKTVKVNKSLDIRDNTPVVNPPKTKAGNREIPIPDKLYGELMRYLTSHKDNYLFTMKNGEVMTRSSFRKMWDSIIRKTQATADTLVESCNMLYPKISFTPHVFRHTYATNLYYANMDIKRSQYLLGHSTLEMTLKTYTHLENINNSNVVAEKLNNFFSQSNVSQNGF